MLYCISCFYIYERYNYYYEEDYKCSFCNRGLCCKCYKYNPIYSNFWCKKLHSPMDFAISLNNLYKKLVTYEDIWEQLEFIIKNFYDIQPIQLNSRLFVGEYNSFKNNSNVKNILNLLVNYCPMKYIYYKINKLLGYNNNYSNKKDSIKSYKSHCRWNYFNYLDKISKVIIILFNYTTLELVDLFEILKNVTNQCKIILVKTILKKVHLTEDMKNKLLFISKKRNCNKIYNMIYKI